MRACLTRCDNAGGRRAHNFLNPGQSFFSFRALTFLSRWDIFELTCNGNFDDARRSNASANARETRRRKRNACITSNDAFFVAYGVRCVPRGVAQIKWDILRHVVGDPTVASKSGTSFTVTARCKGCKMFRRLVRKSCPGFHFPRFGRRSASPTVNNFRSMFCTMKHAASCF